MSVARLIGHKLQQICLRKLLLLTIFGIYTEKVSEGPNFEVGRYTLALNLETASSKVYNTDIDENVIRN
jgi:hypothetical protein